MSSLIYEQAKNVGVMTGCGMIIMAFHQIMTTYTRNRKTGKLIQGIMEVWFWFISAIMASAFLYYSSYGKLAIHSIASLFLGMAVWKWYISKMLSHKIHLK